MFQLTSSKIRIGDRSRFRRDDRIFLSIGNHCHESNKTEGKASKAASRGSEHSKIMHCPKTKHTAIGKETFNEFHTRFDIRAAN